MRAKWIVVVASVALIGSVAASIDGASAAYRAKTKTVKCRAKVTDQAPPTATSGTDFGLLACGKPFGSGVLHHEFTETPTSRTTGTVNASFKWFFDQGTVHGTLKLAATFTGPTSLTFRGTATYTGGTGAFKHVAGSAKLSCRSSDDVHLTCTATSTVSGSIIFPMGRCAGETMGASVCLGGSRSSADRVGGPAPRMFMERVCWPEART
jgi:hypothetical protein